MPATPSPEDPSLARIRAFSDGVFAIAITLLILAIRIPHPTDADADQGLLNLLTQEWRSYLAFVLSFMIVGINWANHRVMFATFVRADHALVWLNLLYLMVGVVFIPVPTAVLGAWLGSPSNQVVAAVFYGAAGTVGALTFILLWWYGAYAARLTSPELGARQRRAHTIAWAPAPLVVGALTVVAFASPSLAVAGYVAVVLLYILPVPRLVALKERRRRAQSSHPARWGGELLVPQQILQRPRSSTSRAPRLADGDYPEDTVILEPRCAFNQRPQIQLVGAG